MKILELPYQGFSPMHSLITCPSPQQIILFRRWAASSCFTVHFKQDDVDKLFSLQLSSKIKLALPSLGHHPATQPLFTSLKAPLISVMLVTKSTVKGVELLNCESWLHHSLAVESHTVYVTYPCLTFLISKAGRLTVATTL